MFLLYLIPIYFFSLRTTCSEAQSSTVLLANPEAGSLIFAGEITDSVFYPDAELTSHLVVTLSVQEQFVGNIPGKAISLLLNSGGPRPAKGEQWLVFTQPHNGHYFAGGLCNETGRLDTTGFTKSMVNRLRLFRDARQAPGYNPIAACHFLSDKIAARGAFLSQKPVGEWRHYYPDGSLRAVYHFDSIGLKHGYNYDYSGNSGKLSAEHYVHGFRDTSWAFFDTTGRVIESSTVFRNTAAGNLEIHRTAYDTLSGIIYADYTLLRPEPSDITGESRNTVLAFSAKKFDPPLDAGSIPIYDRGGRIWRVLDRK